ncbi:DUF4254 domain-containing protein [Nocardia sp. NPDC057353]|uniref:DUF4254 domain-containing protein n=1 Tax=Nocardia sp. NPDC057353 TaxID=3346104 RepID=UPI0036359853
MLYWLKPVDGGGSVHPGVFDGAEHGGQVPRSIGGERPFQLLPSVDELCASIRGHHVAAHPVARLAIEFGSLYQELEFCCRRDRLVASVDSWAIHHLPAPRPDARPAVESFGAVIDRIAFTQVHAYRLLMTADDLAAPRVHAAWHRLAELADGYTDLVAAFDRRAVRLPNAADPVSEARLPEWLR